ncbi:MAG TPA: hypothetical protein V6D29_14330, partial [Leptolyngbyaceae cyanobacterium]
PLPRSSLSFPPCDVLIGIQNQIQRLGWKPAQVINFIADQFNGRRRSQLQDDELTALLYYLQNVGSDNGP